MIVSQIQKAASTKSEKKEMLYHPHYINKL